VKYRQISISELSGSELIDTGTFIIDLDLSTALENDQFILFFFMFICF
jgi:hypothetical protein